MKILTFTFVSVLLTSCFLNKYDRIIKGVYSIENRENCFLNDSSSVEGFVFDKQLNSPLAKKMVSIKDSNIKTITDSSGHFNLIIPEGTYSFAVTAFGLTDLQTKKIRIRKNEKVKIIFMMGAHIYYDK